MAEELEGDLRETVVWGADMSGSTFRDVNLAGARVTQAWLVDVEVDAYVDRLVVNGVDVTDYVNERDPWHPLRALIEADDPDGLREALAALEAAWQQAIERAAALGADAMAERVDDEWSFVETVRHVVFGIDKWFTAPVLGGPFAAIGMPNTGSREFGFPGIELDAAVTIEEALALRAERMAGVATFLAEAGDADLERRVEVLENGPHDVRHCVATVLEEGFWHLRYATRDTEAIESR